MLLSKLIIEVHVDDEATDDVLDKACDEIQNIEANIFETMTENIDKYSDCDNLRKLNPKIIRKEL